MNVNHYLNDILAVLQSVKDDKNKLQKIHSFLFNEIYEEPKVNELPAKYHRVVSEIAHNLIAGFYCF